MLDEIMEEPEDGTRTPVRHTGSQELGKRNSGTGASSYLSPPASALGEDESSEFGGRNSWGRYAGTSGGPLERMVNQGECGRETRQTQTDPKTQKSRVPCPLLSRRAPLRSRFLFGWIMGSFSWASFSYRVQIAALTAGRQVGPDRASLSPDATLSSLYLGASTVYQLAPC